MTKKKPKQPPPTILEVIINISEGLSIGIVLISIALSCAIVIIARNVI